MSTSGAAENDRAAKLAELKAAVARLEAEVDPTDSAEPPEPTSAGQAAKPKPARKPPTRETSERDASAAKAARQQQAETNAAAEEDEEEDQGEEEESRSLGALLRAAPAWLISFIIHMALLIILGLWTIAVMDEPNQVFVLANPIEETEDDFEELTEFESQPVEVVDLETLSNEVEIPDPGEMTLGEFATEPVDATPADIGQLSLPSSIDSIGSLFDGDGKGMANIGSGMGGAASFFGQKVKGKRFVFVVDNSNSMSRGRLETALNELMLSVNRMDKHQRFFVIFFSDAAYPMFHPKPARDMVPATGENKRKLEYWLPKVQMCLRTQGSDAVKMAIAMRPDAIYILGDGAFTDNATDLLTAPHSRKIVINTLGMEVNERGERQLKAIAKANGGTYRAVAATRAAMLSARTNPIPRNRSRGPVWGVKLPPR